MNVMRAQREAHTRVRKRRSKIGERFRGRRYSRQSEETASASLTRRRRRSTAREYGRQFDCEPRSACSPKAGGLAERARAFGVRQWRTEEAGGGLARLRELIVVRGTRARKTKLLRR